MWLALYVVYFPSKRNNFIRHRKKHLKIPRGFSGSNCQLKYENRT